MGTAVGALIWKGEFATHQPPGNRRVCLSKILSAEKESAFFADGVQDGVFTKLAKVANLKVISHTSVLPYRGARNTQQIGRVLNVASRAGGKRPQRSRQNPLNAQLIDTRTDTHVWAEEYDRDLNELFTLQSEITQKVAARLERRSRRPRSRDQRATDHRPCRL